MTLVLSFVMGFSADADAYVQTAVHSAIAVGFAYIGARVVYGRFGPVPAERAIHLLRQVCHSLSEAESRGLVHRDIKPSNIFVCRYGEDDDFVKVLDFGIAKWAGVTGDTEPALTQQHVVRGTPAFMAPEQALGQSDLDGRVDICATGCVAYWLLTGQLVFDAETPMALLLRHASTPPSPPSAPDGTIHSHSARSTRAVVPRKRPC